MGKLPETGKGRREKYGMGAWPSERIALMLGSTELAIHQYLHQEKGGLSLLFNGTNCNDIVSAGRSWSIPCTHLAIVGTVVVSHRSQGSCKVLTDWR